MMDYYLQSIIDHYWQEDDVKGARFRAFEFILEEYRLEHIDLEQFNLLFDLIIIVDKLYGFEKNEE